MNKGKDSRYKYARRLWSDSVLTLFNNTCFLCGRKPSDGERWHAHHIIGASNRHLELLILNGVCLCSKPFPDGRASCHTQVHDDPFMATRLTAEIRQRFPQWWESLMQERKTYGFVGTYTKLEQDIHMLESLKGAA